MSYQFTYITVRIIPIFIICTSALSQTFTIPLNKGNTWVYSYIKTDTLWIPYNGWAYRDRNHYNQNVGNLSFSVDSTKITDNAFDSIFFRIAIIDSGVSHTAIWDTIEKKYDTLTTQYKKTALRGFIFFNDSLLILDTNDIPINLLFYKKYPNLSYGTPGFRGTKRQTDSNEIAIGNQKHTVFSTEYFNGDGSPASGYVYFDTLQWISQIGATFWKFHHEWYNMAPAGGAEFAVYTLQSFNNIKFPLLSNNIHSRPIASMSKNRLKNPSFQIKFYLKNEFKKTEDHLSNNDFNICGQRMITHKSTQLLVYKKCFD